MSSKPKVPDAVIPAVKPERQVDIAPEDVVLGSEEEDTSIATGKRQLTRPRTASTTGLQL